MGKSKLDILDELDQVRDSLGFVTYLLEQVHVPGFSPDACFLREVTRLVAQRADQLEGISAFLRDDA